MGGQNRYMVIKCAKLHDGEEKPLNEKTIYEYLTRFDDVKEWIPK